MVIGKMEVPMCCHNTQKYRICILGAFGFKPLDTGGQPVKTRNLYYALLKNYGTDKVVWIETIGWKKHPIRLFVEVILKAISSKNVIMMPASNGVIVFSQMLCILKKVFRIKIFYDVIGGWLPQLALEKKRLRKCLMKFDGIWVETITMQIALKKLGIDSVFVLPNFKVLQPLQEMELKYPEMKPLKLCTFSRVTEKKGISEAIDVISNINQVNNTIVYSLDIYGPVSEDYKNIFFERVKANSQYIRYMGIVKPNESVEIIKDYFALLFPTKFYTEGIPGTIVDAYASGVPVIASRWQSYADVVIEGETGVSYEFGNTKELKILLEQIALNPQMILTMKKRCLVEYMKYTEAAFLKKLFYCSEL